MGDRGVVVEPASPLNEIEALAHILHICVQEGASVGFLLPFSLDEARDFWRTKVVPEVAAGNRRLLVARIDGRVVGTVQLILAMPANQPHRAEVAKLQVHPEFRRRGVGRALMDAVERVAVEEGRTLLMLDTAVGDAGERLYSALGYVAWGVAPDFAVATDRKGMVASTFFAKRL